MRRRRAGRGFSYLDASGTPVSDRAERDRIGALAIPPAWEDVWISPDPRGHIQATGRDVRGRLQYIYHPDFVASRAATKFDRIVDFAASLPRLRKRVGEDLAGRKPTERLVTAAAVRALDRTLLRVGNAAYAEANGSYGLTTLERSHRRINGSELRLLFTGKGGKEIRVRLSDRRLARVIRRMDELPGYRLFRYLDETGEVRALGSDQVNAYIREATSEAFSAKDFRTWAGTVLAAIALSHCEPPASEREARRQICRAVRQVAGRLGNTLSVCRQSYIHPAIFDGWRAGTLGLRAAPDDIALVETGEALADQERRVLAFLRRGA